MAASSTFQSAFVEKLVVRLLEQLAGNSKWRSQQPDLQPGMLVLLRDNNLPPMSWRLAIISKMFPSSNGHIRVVTPVPTAPGTNPVPCTMGTAIIRGARVRGVALNSHPHLAPMLRMILAVPLLRSLPALHVTGRPLPLFCIFWRY
jgi:hypothetical protein